MLRASSSWSSAVLRKAGRPRVQRMGWGAKFASSATQSLKDASKRLPADEGIRSTTRTTTTKAFVLKAVERDWRALEGASDSLKDNEAVVTAAVKQDGQALEYASASLKDNEAVVTAAVEQDGQALEYASASLKDNEAVVTAAVEKNRSALKHASERLRG